MREYFVQILLMEIEEFMPLWGKKVLDVGGAQGEYCKALNERRKCWAANLEPHPGDCIWPGTTMALADSIPFVDNEFDLVICRGVLEHIPASKQQQSVFEMYRVTKVGGLCYLLIPPWYNPHAGHRLKPFHILPFSLAKRMRQWIFGSKISANSFEEAGLYPITFKRMLEMISLTDFGLCAIRDTHFRLHFLTKVPLLREVAVPAVAFILVKE
jgi:SAM-dependent methyltransferase